MELSPGTHIQHQITKASHPDYTCYTLRGSHNHQIVAVIIETKLTTHSKFKHSVAQVIGYYIAIRSLEMSPPLVFVLSERHVHLVLFPFISSDSEEAPLINAVEFPPISLWDDNGLLHKAAVACICLLLKLAVEERSVRFKYKYRDATKKRALQPFVETITDQQEEKLKQLQQQISDRDEEIAKLRHLLQLKNQ